MANATVQQLIEAGGIMCAIRICRHFSGRFLYIPPHVVETHPLALTVGLDAALKICERWGGEEIEIPAESSALVEVRNRQIAEQYKANATIYQLAQDYGLSRTAIIRILERMGVPRRDYPDQG